MSIEIINLNNYVAPTIKIKSNEKFITNGDNNSFFQYIKERYIGSPTNASVINSYVNYIIGEGLADISNNNIHKYISRNDVRKICQDFKMYGQFSVQIVWSKGSELLKTENKPILIKHINTEKIALNQNALGEVNGYWYSFDWNDKMKYKPQFFSKFDGTYKEEHPVEIITFNRVSTEPYFPQPDYLSGLQWAHTEEELSNSAINHILNGFSAGRILNFKGGIPPSEELKQQYVKTITEKLTGTSNKNKWMINFQADIDGNSIEVINMQIDQLDAQLVYFSEEAQKKLFISHSVVNPILFGVRDGSGLGSNKDEMKEALKTLYRSNINPMREVIIDSLESIFKHIDDSIKLEFLDFEELRVEDGGQNNLQ